MAYNTILVPLSEELKNQKVMIAIDYEMAQAIGNALYDLHQETDKPHNRLADYPAKELHDLHNKIFMCMSNCCLALEEKYRNEKHT